jgi:hypothetical protein
MSAPGFTPISLYFSTTAAATPSAGNLANGELAVNITDGKLFYKDNGGVVRVLATTAGSAGDVVGPGSSTDNALVRFDTTTGKLVQNSVGILSDAGVLTGLTGLTSSGSITFSSLTSGRVPYATTAGLLTDSANLAFDGTTLTSAFAGPHNGTVGASTPNTGAFTTLSASGNVTLSGGTANGVAYLNGSKVLTTGSALTFDGTVLLSGAGGTGTNNSILKLSGSNASNYGAYLQFLRNGTPTWSIGNDSAINGGSSDDLTIYGTSSQRFYASGSEQMRLTSTGLGIGTSSPGYKLDVASGDTSAGQAIRIRANSSAGAGGLQFTDSAASSQYGWIKGKTTGLSFYSGNNTAGDLFLDASGNLGLGVTPSAWGGSYKALQFSAGSFSGNAGAIGLEQNAYQNGTNWIYRNTAAASHYETYGGAHYWFNAPSGTAGNAISFTQAMTLNASGNLLVGTTSASAPNPGFLVLPNFSTIGGIAKIGHSNGAASGTTFLEFLYNGGYIGGVTQNGTTGVLYNITSDYRLKVVTGVLSGHGERIDALEPIEYTWNSDGSKARGFLAHRFQDVYPNSVAGEKDAVDSDGKPVYQSMQAGTSEVIADLVAEIQSLRARVAALESN